MLRVTTLDRSGVGLRLPMRCGRSSYRVASALMFLVGSAAANCQNPNVQRCARAMALADSIRAVEGQQQYHASPEGLAADTTVIDQCGSASPELPRIVGQSNSRYSLGNAYEETGDTANAIRYYRMVVHTAITTGFDSLDAHSAAHELGILLWAQGQHAEAITAQRQAIHLVPLRMPSAWRGITANQIRALDTKLLALCFELDGQWENALAAFQAAQQIDPNDTSAATAIAHVWAVMRAALAMRSDPRWRVISPPGNDPLFAYDTSQVIRTACCVDVWFRMIYLTPHPEPDNKLISSALVHDIVDCVGKHIAQLSGVTYDANGDVVRSESAQYPMSEYDRQKLLQPVVPGSVGELELNGVCR